MYLADQRIRAEEVEKALEKAEGKRKRSTPPAPKSRHEVSDWWTS